MSCETEREEEMLYIDLVSEILEGVLAETEDEQDDEDLFSSNKIPDISIRAYMQRVKTRIECCNDSLIKALIYIDRYTMADSNFKLSYFSIHRLLLVSILIAVKIHEDVYYDNETFAMAGGVPLKQLNELEWHFLKTLEFRAFIPHEEFNDYKTKILQEFQ